ncbi:MAG: penicillin-binding protein, partial [Firmicutes bacterium]|nr:penicillin-binding protein [Bacillota bacterium]
MESRKQRHEQKSAKHNPRHFFGKIFDLAAVISLPTVVIFAALILLPISWLALPVPTLPADTMIYDQKGHLVSVLAGSANRIPVT